MIELREVTFRYGDEFTLRVEALTVAQGERVALVGPSGSGKTTLVHLLAGILPAASGSVRVDGVDLAGLDDAARRRFRIERIGFVFQELELLAHLTVLDNVMLPFFLNRALTADRAARARAEALAGTLGLQDKLGRHPGELSQGERQRVAIGRALVTGPRLLIADEPTGNLDGRTARRALDALEERVEAEGATLLCVTHDTSLLERFDRTIDMDELLGGPP